MSSFQGSIDGNIVIPGTYTAAGGTTHFNFGCQPGQNQPGRLRKPFSTVPFALDPDFVDRPDIIAWVRDKCARPGARAALVGLGGVGKSQLAIQHAHQVRDAAPNTYVFWVYASTRARFEEAYRDIAGKLQLPGRQDPNVDVLRLVSDWLCDEANGQWAMVIDNVDDIETFFPLLGKDKTGEGLLTPLAEYLPQSRNGSILITSRSRNAAARLAGGYNNVKEVLAMDESQGLELLRNKLATVATDQSGAVELVCILDQMPLAITQAAAYINQRAHMTIARYIREFRMNGERRESLLHYEAGDLRRDVTAANSVVTTWQISFERIQHERPSAAGLLSIMSFFNPQEIPEKTLRAYGVASVRAETGDDHDKADRLFDEDIDILYAYSLVAVLKDKGAYEMHALVQFCTHVWLSSLGKAEWWRCCFIQLLAFEFPNGHYETWAECQRLLPHVEPLFDDEPSCEETAKAWAQILTNAAWYLWHKGSYEAAQAVATNAMTTQERILGLDDQQTLRSVTLLVMVLENQSKYDEAEKLNRRVLAGLERELGEHHPDTLTMLRDLGSVLQSQGKTNEAERLHRRVLLERKRELGEYHVDTLKSVIHLAVILRGQGRYEEAERMSQQALAGMEKELGEDHRVTLRATAILALVLRDRCKYEDAEKMSRRALAGMEKELGEHHPDTLMSLHCLANLLHEMKHYTEAETLYQRACKGFVQTMGAQHPRTIGCERDLVVLQQEMQEAKQAVLLENNRMLGRYHLFVARTVGKLSRRHRTRD